jgi:hypothetical protein
MPDINPIPSGGCRIVEPPPQGWKCHCNYYVGYVQILFVPFHMTLFGKGKAEHKIMLYIDKTRNLLGAERQKQNNVL